jgi:hypothetical protein
VLPGFAKFVVIKKPATSEGAGINPFSRESTAFKARSARKVVRARALRTLQPTDLRPSLNRRTGAHSVSLTWVDTYELALV